MTQEFLNQNYLQFCGTEPVTTYPLRHGVCLSVAMVVVQDQDGRHHAGRNHEHDGIEVCS